MWAVQDHLDEVRARIVEIGLERMPNETGGLIIPMMDQPAEQWVVELTNISEEPRDSCLFDMMKEMDRLEIPLLKTPDPTEVWAWHTHPGGNVGPSRHDLQTRVDGVKYLVVSLPEGVAVRY